MAIAEELLQTLRAWHRMPAGELLRRLQVSRATMMRAIQSLGPQIVSRGQARRTAYAARRGIRGSMTPIPLFRIDRAGRGSEVALLEPIYPHGCAMKWHDMIEWPLDESMRDGWFDGFPYFLDDMRPQGFLGRNFAHQHAGLLQVAEDPLRWSEDDVIHLLALLGADQPGNYILGETAYRRHLAALQADEPFLTDADIENDYPAQAQAALALGIAGSSAGGEFPKFTARRMLDGAPAHVIVKFSGDDDSAGTRRWGDLLVCEHLALRAVAKHLHIEAAVSSLYQFGGRTFLEVRRFDRHGAFGRSPVCSWAALNAALFGLAGKTWAAGATALRVQGLIGDAAERDIQRLWHFGQLIANTDMHDGNLAFQPGLTLAPIYDMLPMLYAPARGVELPARQFVPALPLPAEQAAWREAALAAIHFWRAAADDGRIGAAFRRTCADNGDALQKLL